MRVHMNCVNLHMINRGSSLLFFIVIDSPYMAFLTSLWIIEIVKYRYATRKLQQTEGRYNLSTFIWFSYSLIYFECEGTCICKLSSVCMYVWGMLCVCV